MRARDVTLPALGVPTLPHLVSACLKAGPPGERFTALLDLLNAVRDCLRIPRGYSKKFLGELFRMNADGNEHIISYLQTNSCDAIFCNKLEGIA
jgi:hypothetical protein